MNAWPCPPPSPLPTGRSGTRGAGGLAQDRLHLRPAPGARHAAHLRRLGRASRVHAGRRRVHPGRPVRGLGRRRCPRKRLRARVHRSADARGEAAHARLHGRQPRLPGRRRDAAATAACAPWPTRPCCAPSASAAADPRRRAVPGRPRLPAVPRPGAQRRLAARLPRRGRWPSASRRAARAMRDASEQHQTPARRPRTGGCRRGTPVAGCTRARAPTLVHGHTHRPATRTWRRGVRAMCSATGISTTPPTAARRGAALRDARARARPAGAGEHGMIGGWWRRRRERARWRAARSRTRSVAPHAGALPVSSRSARRRPAELRRSGHACSWTDKEFTGAQGLEVDDDMAVAIAAQACLPVLRLGLARYDGFVGIVVHPDEVQRAARSHRRCRHRARYDRRARRRGDGRRPGDAELARRGRRRRDGQPGATTW